MGNPVLYEGGVGESGRTGGRDTAPVVHVHVDDHAPLLHLGDSLAVYQGRRTGTHDMDRPYKEVRAQHGVPDPEAARRQGRGVGQAGILDLPEVVEVLIYDDHLGPEAAGHPGGPGSDDPRAEDDHASRPHARRAAEEYSAAPEGSLQVVGTYLRGEEARDLAHWREHGQEAPLVPDRLHGEGDAPGVDKGLHQLRVDRQGEERDEDQILSQVPVFFLYRPVDLDDDLGVGVDPPCLFDEACACLLVTVVGDARGLPRPGLDEDPVSRSGQLVYGVRGQRDPALPLGPLGWHPDPHRPPPSRWEAWTEGETVYEHRVLMFSKGTPDRACDPAVQGVLRVLSTTGGLPGSSVIPVRLRGHRGRSPLQVPESTMGRT